jgi:hypothetical protein
MEMPAGERYGAKIVIKCDFVEGHRCLSPTTRDRFLLRRTIKWSSNEGYAGPVCSGVEEEGDVTARVIVEAAQR